MNRTLEIEVKKNEKDKFETGPMLSREHKDSIQWRAREGRSFTICFNREGEGTPFHESRFVVDSVKGTNSGPVKDSAADGDYHYEILHGDKKCPLVGTNSPKVRIKP
jgi:hypothetical protein